MAAAPRLGVLALAGLLLPVLCLLPAAAAARGVGALAALAVKPTPATAAAAYLAARRCDFAGGADRSAAYLVAVAATASYDPAGGRLGGYRNPFGDPGAVPGDLGVDAAALRRGGRTHRELGLPDLDWEPADWTTVLPGPTGERGVGFLLLAPSEWRLWSAEVAGPPRALDPYRPQDAFLAVACHLRRLVEQPLRTGLDGALLTLGSGRPQFADQVAEALRLGGGGDPAALARSLTAVVGAELGPGLSMGEAFLRRVREVLGPGPAANPAVPVADPLPEPGWIRRIPLPAFPADLSAHVPEPVLYRNQCTYGALATWWYPHRSDPRWAHPPRITGDAWRFLAGAERAGYSTVMTPAVGAIAVYGPGGPGGRWPGDLVGHVATVVAVAPDRFEVIEQNVLDSKGAAEPRWGTFDLRVNAWPDRGVEGFIVAPPGV